MASVATDVFQSSRIIFLTQRGENLAVVIEGCSVKLVDLARNGRWRWRRWSVEHAWRRCIGFAGERVLPFPLEGSISAWWWVVVLVGLGVGSHDKKNFGLSNHQNFRVKLRNLPRRVPRQLRHVTMAQFLMNDTFFVHFKCLSR